MQKYVKNEKRYRLINFICLLAVYKKLIGTGRVLGTSILRYAWLMRFNARKCHLLKITRQREPLQTQYSIDDSHLEEVQHHPYLGVELTSDLTWKSHITIIRSARANRILNLLRRHLYGCSQEVKSRTFTTLVRPHLEYSSTVWDPYFKQDKQSL